MPVGTLSGAGLEIQSLLEVVVLIDESGRIGVVLAPACQWALWLAVAGCGWLWPWLAVAVAGAGVAENVLLET